MCTPPRRKWASCTRWAFHADADVTVHAILFKISFLLEAAWLWPACTRVAGGAACGAACGAADVHASICLEHLLVNYDK